VDWTSRHLRPHHVISNASSACANSSAKSRRPHQVPGEGRGDREALHGRDLREDGHPPAEGDACGVSGRWACWHPSVKMINNPLEARFEEQLKLMRVLCDCYDADNEVVALSIATAVRVLVHDTSKSTSLLTHLDKKNGQYLSANFKTPKEIVHLGLVRRINVGVKDGVGGEARYWPLRDERYFPSPRQQPRLLRFEDWWKEHVFQNDKYCLTRQDLVLAVANKDGGAHVDSEVDERYDEFRKSWSGGSTLVGIRSGARRGYDNIPIYPAIRQIGYELLQSSFADKASALIDPAA